MYSRGLAPQSPTFVYFFVPNANLCPTDSLTTATGCQGCQPLEKRHLMAEFCGYWLALNSSASQCQPSASQLAPEDARIDASGR